MTMAAVLVVDDEPLVRGLLVDVLKQEGFSVFAAASGSQALSIFRLHTGEISLLISDVMMPGMDGASLATTIQAERPGLPVLLISGCCEDKYLDSPFEFLPKPFSISELLTRIRSLT